MPLFVICGGRWYWWRSLNWRFGCQSRFFPLFHRPGAVPWCYIIPVHSGVPVPDVILRPLRCWLYLAFLAALPVNVDAVALRSTVVMIDPFDGTLFPVSAPMRLFVVDAASLFRFPVPVRVVPTVESVRYVTLFCLVRSRRCPLRLFVTRSPVIWYFRCRRYVVRFPIPVAFALRHLSGDLSIWWYVRALMVVEQVLTGFTDPVTFIALGVTPRRCSAAAHCLMPLRFHCVVMVLLLVRFHSYISRALSMPLLIWFLRSPCRWSVILR